MHKLLAPSLLDPRWFQKVRYGLHEASVIDSQSVNLEGQVLRLADPQAIQLVSSQKVYVTLLSQFYLQTEAEYQETLCKARERIAREKQQWKEQLNQARTEAEAFNSTLHIPVRWVPGIKDVLSGLTENSWGDGHNAATVQHIMLKEDLQDGRLVRYRGDFLCTSASRSNGQNIAGQPESLACDGDGNEYQPKVTCKTCLKLAERWSRQ